MKIGMLLNDEEWAGRNIPKWYGVSYRVFGMRQTMLHLIPLNIFVGFARKIYYRIVNFLKRGIRLGSGDYVQRIKQLESEIEVLEYKITELKQNKNKRLEMLVGKIEKINRGEV